MAKCLGSWARAPLALSVIEIGYAKRANFREEVQALGALQQSGEYPFVEDGKVIELKVQSAADQLQVQHEESECRVFVNANRSVAARVLPTKLSFFDADYSGNFRGSTQRLRSVLDQWSVAARALTINEVRVRTLDVACPPDGTSLSSWLCQKWHAGDLEAPGSRGISVRDFDRPDGSYHIRVRTVHIKPKQKIGPPPDLMMAVHVKLPTDLVGPFDREAVVAIVDVERVVKSEGFSVENLDEVLLKAHDEATTGFEDVFEGAAIDYFRGKDLAGAA